jgi:hypothetical protein
MALSLESIQGEASFMTSAHAFISSTGIGGPSRQAVSKRTNAPFLKVLEALLAKAIATKTDCESLACQDSTLSNYDRVLVQDSTFFDRMVLLGNKEKTRVRLVSAPVSDGSRQPPENEGKKRNERPQSFRRSARPHELDDFPNDQRQ